ncbi:hypothetical protein VNO77_42017 [Canavalia gladiata]|uniref:Uncharacterized protein n=1 Tax=Canavalia gladiata TaxID=3824 RepID=A0AAN9K0A0_CANGL
MGRRSKRREREKGSEAIRKEKPTWRKVELYQFKRRTKTHQRSQVSSATLTMGQHGPLNGYPVSRRGRRKWTLRFLHERITSMSNTFEVVGNTNGGCAVGCERNRKLKSGCGIYVQEVATQILALVNEEGVLEIHHATLATALDIAPCMVYKRRNVVSVNFVSNPPHVAASKESFGFLILKAYEPKEGVVVHGPPSMQRMHSTLTYQKLMSPSALEFKDNGACASGVLMVTSSHLHDYILDSKRHIQTYDVIATKIRPTGCMQGNSSASNTCHRNSISREPHIRHRGANNQSFVELIRDTELYCHAYNKASVGAPHPLHEARFETPKPPFILIPNRGLGHHNWAK